MKWLFPLSASLALASLIDRRDARINYNGYRVFRVDVADADAEGLHTAKTALNSVNALELHAPRDYIEVAVSPDAIGAFDALGLNTTLLVGDLGVEMMSETLETYESPVEVAAIPSVSYFTAYHDYDEHQAFLRDLQSAFSANSEILNIGASFEGRQLQVFHLWGSGGKGLKPAIYIHGTVHAREWIATMVAEYIAYQLVLGYSSDTAVTTVLNSYDFYIVPIVNPDGFVYTQTTNRLWRKNRQVRSGISAVGTDINRNWPYQWSGSGSSTSPSAEDYRGQAAGDTPENRAIRALSDTLGNSTGIQVYIDFHSYGPYILIPKGYSCTAEAPNQAKQLRVARLVRTAIASSYGTDFTTGQSCRTLYAVNGGSNDYVGDVNGADFSWAVELRGGGSGTSGFILPAAQIRPSGVELWNGMKTLFANIK